MLYIKITAIVMINATHEIRRLLRAEDLRFIIEFNYI
jgi:hypothetical protein